jgi:GntR family transcriptional regulator, transcriptional repressor for pyruvate dehydrogenase complex
MDKEADPKNVNLRRAKPVRLFEQAVEQIKTLILEGTLKPGDKLPSENKLSKMLEVSRPSVREALRALESKGVILVKSGAGTFVTDDALIITNVNEAVRRLLLRKDLVLQILQVREVMECLSVSKASESIDPEELESLIRNVECQEEIINNGLSPEDYLKLSELDADFHIILSRASRNDIVYEILNALLPSFQDDNKTIIYFEKALCLVKEHRDILNSVISHDARQAELQMRKHIHRVVNEVMDLNNHSAH